MGSHAVHPGRWQRRLEPADGSGIPRFRCLLCPRECTLEPGQRGFCFVRQATEAGIGSTTYGRSSGFCIDPIEKKPLYHFYPGTPILSFGTAGCNLGCRFCQNWDLSRARRQDRLQERASPRAIAALAGQHDCASVAFTYNEPIIFAEYAIDTAAACHEQELHAVAVTAGYLSERARPAFFGAMDAANIDLKAFSDAFYRKMCGARLGPVLDSIRYAVQEARIWVELTTLLIPGANDDSQELDAMTRWIVDELGADVPLHFSAFHPAHKLLDRPRTSLKSLRRARRIARGNGLRHVFLGNVRDREGGSSWCAACGALLVERLGYQLGRWGIDAGRCGSCGEVVVGRFAAAPGGWGPRRRRIPS